MKRKQKSCQNEPSAGRFDGPHTRFEQGKCRLTGQTTAMRCLESPKDKVKEGKGLFIVLKIRNKKAL
jgi:hypothetical protein